MKQHTNITPRTTATTDCNEEPLLFPELSAKTVSVDFEGGHVSSDSGGVLLARLDRSYGYLQRFAACFHDHRDPELIEHQVIELLRQRIYGLALGYEDLNDHDRLCRDPLLASLCGKRDVLGKNRQRQEDQGKALAGKSTLNRLELTPAEANAHSRYKKIVACDVAIEDYFIDEWVGSLGAQSTEVILDLDRTDDPVHGQQEGRFFHGYYDAYCYTPLYIFAGDWPVVAALHTGEAEHVDEVLRLLAKVVERARGKRPSLKIVVRGDSGFCRDALMTWCEGHGVDYVLGLARNKVLERILRGTLRSAKSMLDFNQSPAERLFKDFRYRAKSWQGRKRRVVGKAEVTRDGANPRFVITSLDQDSSPARELYEQRYCGRGNMENRIKEQKLDLFAGRTSTELLRANQLRLWFSTLAYLLVNQLRRVGLSGTQLAAATCATIRLRLFKIGAVIRVTARRIWVGLSSAYPLQELFALVAERLKPVAAG